VQPSTGSIVGEASPGKETLMRVIAKFELGGHLTIEADETVDGKIFDRYTMIVDTPYTTLQLVQLTPNDLLQVALTVTAFPQVRKLMDTLNVLRKR
jgi:hypothetical protein